MSILKIFENAKKQRELRAQKKILKHVAVGAAVGVTVGTVAGVLLAPQSGKETREELAQTAQVVIDKTRLKLAEVKQKAEGVVEDVRGKVKQEIEKIENIHCRSEKVVAIPEETVLVDMEKN